MGPCSFPRTGAAPPRGEAEEGPFLSPSLGVVQLQLVDIRDLHTKVDPEETGRSSRAPAGLVTSLKRQENTSDTKTSSCGMLEEVFLGELSYLDFSHPLTLAWHSRRFSLDNYEVPMLNVLTLTVKVRINQPPCLSGIDPTSFVWLDMNEPSVCDGPEQTVQRCSA